MGRPKQFDRDEVLEAALDLLWQRGYHDVSVRELAATMGINVATLYSEFGDKQSLLTEATTRYDREHVGRFIGALEAPGADLDAIESVLRSFAAFAASGTAAGCLITNCAMELAPDPRRSQETMLAYVGRLQRAFEHALTDAQHPARPSERDELAHSLTATTLGIFVLVRAKVPADVVARIVDGAVASLPRRPRTRPTHP